LATGLRIGARITRIPSGAKTSAKTSANLLSRSRIRNRNRSSTPGFLPTGSGRATVIGSKRGQTSSPVTGYATPEEERKATSEA
jgi:hypothetical protein